MSEPPICFLPLLTRPQGLCHLKSTLEEVCLADLLLHVVDVADPEYEKRIIQTRQVLAEIGAENVPYLLIYNKIDMVGEFCLPSLDGVKAFPISALNRLGLSSLQAELIVASGQNRYN